MNQPCSNTAALDEFEIKNDKQDSEQEILDKMVEEKMEVYTEDPTYFYNDMYDGDFYGFAASLLNDFQISDSIVELGSNAQDSILDKMREVAERVVREEMGL